MRKLSTAMTRRKTYAALIAATIVIGGWAASMPAGTPASLPMLLPEARHVEALEEARRLMVEMRFEEAEEHLEQLKLEDAQAASLHHLALVSLIRGMIGNEQEHLGDFFDRSDRLKRALQGERPSAWKMYFTAENELNRAIAYLKLGRTVRAAMAGRAAYGTYESIAREHPDFEEAHKGLGVLKLAIGTLPSRYRAILKLLGYNGGVREGLTLLRRAAYESDYGAEEAGIFLALLTAQVERSSDEPVRLLASLYERHSDSPLIGYLYGYMLMHHRQATRAETVLRELVAVDDGRQIEYARYYLGKALYLQGRYEEAVIHYRDYLDLYDGDELRATAMLSLGLAYELGGNRAEAVTWYRRVDGNRGYDTDRAAEREAARRLQHPITGIQRSLLLARNAFDRGDSDAAVTLLTSVLKDPAVSPEERAEAAYRMGRSYHTLGREDEALAWYAQGGVNADHIQGRWAPWGHFYRAEIFAHRGDVDRAREEYQSAVDIPHDYDYRDALHQSVRGALELLG